MRFAWLRQNSANPGSARSSAANRLILIAYNLIWWIPVLLPFTGIIDYRAGFFTFFVITINRAEANLYRNNVLEPEQAESFPLRSP